jgi:hypothetical protein
MKNKFFTHYFVISKTLFNFAANLRLMICSTKRRNKDK